MGQVTYCTLPFFECVQIDVTQSLDVKGTCPKKAGPLMRLVRKGKSLDASGPKRKITDASGPKRKGSMMRLVGKGRSLMRLVRKGKEA